MDQVDLGFALAFLGLGTLIVVCATWGLVRPPARIKGQSSRYQNTVLAGLLLLGVAALLRVAAVGFATAPNAGMIRITIALLVLLFTLFGAGLELWAVIKVRRVRSQGGAE